MSSSAICSCVQVGAAEMATDQFGSGGGFSSLFNRSDASWQQAAVAAYLKLGPSLPKVRLLPPCCALGLTLTCALGPRRFTADTVAGYVAHPAVWPRDARRVGAGRGLSSLRGRQGLPSATHRDTTEIPPRYHRDTTETKSTWAARSAQRHYSATRREARRAARGDPHR